jgi:hypothetical protein
MVDRLSAEGQNFEDPPQAANSKHDAAFGLTVFASVVAFFLAIGRGIFPNGRVIQYDASLAIYTVTFMGVAWYTYYQRRTLLAQESALEYARWQYRDERRQTQQVFDNERQTRTRGVSTAVLAELQPLAARLRSLRDAAPYSYHDPFRHPLVTDALQHVELFDSDTVRGLAEVSGRLHEVEDLVANHRTARETWLLAAAQYRHLHVTSRNQNEVRVALEEATRYEQNVGQIEFLVQVIGTDAHNNLAAQAAILRAKTLVIISTRTALRTLLADPF